MRRRTEVVEQPTGIFIAGTRYKQQDRPRTVKQQNSPEARPYRPFIPLIAYGVMRHCVRAPGQVDLACSG